MLERETNDALGPGDRDRLDRDPAVGSDLLLLHAVEEVDDLLRVRRAFLVLDAGIEVFGVLADDGYVGSREGARDAGVVLARPQAGVQVELRAQRNVNASETGPDGGRDGALDRNLVLADDAAYAEEAGHRQADEDDDAPANHFAFVHVQSSRGSVGCGCADPGLGSGLR